ncbi:MAG: site-2 protease family protein [Euryarchaeota archaeon]
MPGIAKLAGTALKVGYGWGKTLKTLGISALLHWGIWGPVGLAVVVGVFFHELGHYIACRLLGVPASAPVFLPFGGAFVEHLPTTPDTEALIAAAGPFSGALAGLLLLPVVPHGAAWNAALQLANLLPIPPLDGSKVMAGLRIASARSLAALGLAALTVPLCVVPVALVLH